MSKISMLVLTLAGLFSLPAVGADDKGISYTPRQLAHCVMDRTKASPNESYKVAFKLCRDQLEAEGKTQTAMNQKTA
jgi:hypothetical protein